ncbi:hypothetical protein, partial [Salmonella sp. 6201]|uniref:hypothetical protein n=1 Tax=Salmonella sp. 6201 TaxID=3159577 RepID=UPI00397AA1EB
MQDRRQDHTKAAKFGAWRQVTSTFANPVHAGEMRRILLSTAKILISAALLYLALRKVDLTELLSRFTASSLFWIGMA